MVEGGVGVLTWPVVVVTTGRVVVVGCWVVEVVVGVDVVVVELVVVDPGWVVDVEVDVELVDVGVEGGWQPLL